MGIKRGYLEVKDPCSILNVRRAFADHPRTCPRCRQDGRDQESIWEESSYSKYSDSLNHRSHAEPAKDAYVLRHPPVSGENSVDSSDPTAP